MLRAILGPSAFEDVWPAISARFDTPDGNLNEHINSGHVDGCRKANDKRLDMHSCSDCELIKKIRQEQQTSKQDSGEQA